MSTTASKSGKNDDNVIFGVNQREVQRLDMQHRVIFAAMPKLIQAPIDLSSPGLRILDQATGSGIWLRDVRAATNAQHTWIGTDIEDSYFPTSPPADTSYFHQSMTEAWPTDWKESFDLVHSRMALPGVGTHPLDDVVQNLIALVKPGGWIQLVEMEWDCWDVGPEGKIFHDAVKSLFSLVSNSQGVDLREKLVTILQRAGMQKMEHNIFTIPTGARAGRDIRALSEASLLATATSVSDTMKILSPHGLDRETLDVMPQKLMKENREEGSEFKLFAIWAQRP